MFTVLVILAAILAIAHAQTGGCAAGDNNITINYIYANGAGTFAACNVDPSQAYLGVAFGVVAKNCAAGGSNAYFIAQYYNSQNSAYSTLYGGPSYIPQSTAATFYATISNLAYSVLPTDRPYTIAVTMSPTDGSTPTPTNNKKNVALSQTFIQTMFSVNGTSTAYITVPSTSSVTSTITNTAIVVGPAETVNVTVSGSTTVTATASTST